MQLSPDMIKKQSGENGRIDGGVLNYTFNTNPEIIWMAFSFLDLKILFIEV